MMQLHTLWQTALQTVKSHAMIETGDTVTAGVSGGADSVAMLGFLKELRQTLPFTLQVAHVHHGIRGAEADRDRDLVHGLCEEWNIPFFETKVNVPALAKEKGMGLEECGRLVRYEFFGKIAGTGKIATAHTQNDNAETVLLNLIRGTGLTGLCGIHPVRGNVIRPLLNCSRPMTEDFCKAFALPYTEDATNADDAYRRNEVRHRILPLCSQMNPAFLQTVSHTAVANRRDAEYLQKEGKVLAAQAKRPEGYDVQTLGRAPEAVLFYALRSMAGQAGMENLSATHWNQLVSLVQKGQGQVALPGNITGVITGRQLRFCAQMPPEEPPVLMDLPLGQPITCLGKTVTVDITKIHNLLSYNGDGCDTIQKHLKIGNRQPGDAVTLPGRKVTKSLKKLFNEMAVPLEQRSRLLVIRLDDTLLWVEGVGLSVVGQEMGLQVQESATHV